MTIDRYDAMNGPIDRANAQLKELIEALAVAGIEVKSSSEADYDVDAEVVLTDALSIQVCVNEHLMVLGEWKNDALHEHTIAKTVTDAVKVAGKFVKGEGWTAKRVREELPRLNVLVGPKKHKRVGRTSGRRNPRATISVDGTSDDIKTGHPFLDFHVEWHMIADHLNLETPIPVKVRQ